MEGIRLDQHALKIQLTQQLLEDSSFVVGARGVAGLGDRHAQGCGVQRHLGNEGGTAATGGLDRTAQGLAIADQLIEIDCPTWDLSNRPVPDRGADGSDIHLQEEVAKGGVRRRTLELDPKRLREHSVMTPGKTLQVPEALALAQDPEHRHQQQVPGRDPDALPHAGIGDGLEKADQVEIGCGSSDFRHRETMTAPIEVDGETRARETVTYFESDLPAAESALSSWPILPPAAYYQFSDSSLQYGASHVAAKYCGLMDTPCSIAGRWEHGWHAPYKLRHPILTTLTPVSQATNIRFFVANRTISERLVQEGYDAVPVGLPIAYARSPQLHRRERTLLVMPQHSTAETSLSCYFEEYVREINKIRESFDKVAVCLHSSCLKKGYWANEFKSYGYNVIRGADPNDKNSLVRMQALFKQFEYVTTNSYSSCIAYASAYGAKVFIYGSFCELQPRELMEHPYYKRNPNIAELACLVTGKSCLEQNYPSLFCDHQNAQSNCEWGLAEIGAYNMVSPSEMRFLFGVNWSRRFCLKSRAKKIIKI